MANANTFNPIYWQVVFAVVAMYGLLLATGRVRDESPFSLKLLPLRRTKATGALMIVAQAVNFAVVTVEPGTVKTFILFFATLAAASFGGWLYDKKART
jgi:hypothetical protein